MLALHRSTVCITMFLGAAHCREPDPVAYSSSVAAAVVSIHNPDSLTPGAGSGFFVNIDGTVLIVTARHVVAGGGRPTVHTWLRTLDAPLAVVYPETRIIGVDFDADLAILEVANLPAATPTLELEESGQVTPGAELVVWGNPATPTLSSKTIGVGPTSVRLQQVLSEAPFDLWSGRLRPDRGELQRLYLLGEVKHGHSGGPVLDSRTNRVVGVVSMGLEKGQGIAIPAGRVQSLIARARPGSSISREQAQDSLRSIVAEFVVGDVPVADFERFVAPSDIVAEMRWRMRLLSGMGPAAQHCATSSSSPTECFERGLLADAGEQSVACLVEGLSRCGDKSVLDCRKQVQIGCARSVVPIELQAKVRRMLSYENGDALAGIEVVSEPQQDANPNLWHMNVSWTVNSVRRTRRLTFERDLGLVFARVWGTDGKPLPEPEPIPAESSKGEESVDRIGRSVGSAQQQMVPQRPLAPDLERWIAEAVEDLQAQESICTAVAKHESALTGSPGVPNNCSFEVLDRLVKACQADCLADTVLEDEHTHCARLCQASLTDCKGQVISCLRCVVSNASLESPLSWQGTLYEFLTPKLGDFGECHLKVRAMAPYRPMREARTPIDVCPLFRCAQ